MLDMWQTQEYRKLLVSFQNGERKIYDCSPLLEKAVFQPLKNKAFFKAVRADPGGYGISWGDEIDLAESELWVNGVPVEESKDLLITNSG